MQAALINLTKCMSPSNMKHMWQSTVKILKKKAQGVLPVPWDSIASKRLVFDGDGKSPYQVEVAGDMFKCECAKFSRL